MGFGVVGLNSLKFFNIQYKQHVGSHWEIFLNVTSSELPYKLRITAILYFFAQKSYHNL